MSNTTVPTQDNAVVVPISQEEVKEIGQDAYFNQLKETGDASRLMVSRFQLNSVSRGRSARVNKAELVDMLRGLGYEAGVHYTLESLWHWSGRERGQSMPQATGFMSKITSFFRFFRRLCVHPPVCQSDDAYLITFSSPLSGEALDALGENYSVICPPADFQTLKSPLRSLWWLVLFFAINITLMTLQNLGLLLPAMVWTLPAALGGGVIASGYWIYMGLFFLSLGMVLAISRHTWMKLGRRFWHKCHGYFQQPAPSTTETNASEAPHQAKQQGRADVYVDLLSVAFACVPLFLATALFFTGSYAVYGVVPPFLLVWVTVFCLLLGKRIKAMKHNSRRKQSCYNHCINYIRSNAKVCQLKPIVASCPLPERSVLIDGVPHVKTAISWLDVRKGMLLCLGKGETLTYNGEYQGYLVKDVAGHRLDDRKNEAVKASFEAVTGEPTPAPLQPKDSGKGLEVTSDHQCVFKMTHDASERRYTLYDGYTSITNIAEQPLFEDAFSRRWLFYFTAMAITTTVAGFLFWSFFGNWTLGLYMASTIFNCARFSTIFAFVYLPKLQMSTVLNQNGFRTDISHADMLEGTRPLYFGFDLTGTLTVPEVKLVGWQSCGDTSDPSVPVLDRQTLMGLLYQTEETLSGSRNHYAHAIAKWALARFREEGGDLNALKTGYVLQQPVPTSTNEETAQSKTALKAPVKGVNAQFVHHEQRLEMHVGDRRYAREKLGNEVVNPFAEQMDMLQNRAKDHGCYPVYLWVNQRLCGAIFVKTPSLKRGHARNSGTVECVKYLAKLYKTRLIAQTHNGFGNGVPPVVFQVLSGNNDICVDAVRRELIGHIKDMASEPDGVVLTDDEINAFFYQWRGDLTPQGKADIVKSWGDRTQARNVSYKTFFMGDGANDQLACLASDVPIAVTLEGKLAFETIDLPNKPALGLLDDPAALTAMMNVCQEVKKTCRGSLFALFIASMCSISFSSGGVYLIFHVLLPFLVASTLGIQIQIFGSIATCFLMSASVLAVIDQLIIAVPTLYFSYRTKQLSKQIDNVIAKASLYKVLSFEPRTHTDTVSAVEVSRQLHACHYESDEYTLSTTCSRGVIATFNEYLGKKDISKIRQTLETENGGWVMMPLAPFSHSESVQGGDNPFLSQDLNAGLPSETVPISSHDHLGQSRQSDVMPPTIIES